MYRSTHSRSDSEDSSGPDPFVDVLSQSKVRARPTSISETDTTLLPDTVIHELADVQRRRNAEATSSASTTRVSSFTSTNSDVIQTPPPHRRRETARIPRRAMNAPRQHEPSITIALDFGTTFTGVAYAKVQSAQIDLNDIIVIRNWNRHMTNRDKIRSLKSYTVPDKDEEVEQYEQWGSDLSRHAVAMLNMKLELNQNDRAEELDMLLCLLEGTYDLDFEEIRATDGTPEYSWKDPESIIKDFLTHVIGSLDAALALDIHEMRYTWPMDVVITVPVQWSYDARNATVRAIQQAGLSKLNYPKLRNISLVTEPEAAAIYTARHCLETQSSYRGLGVGKCFIILDAGGGTVDLVSYRVRQVDPAFKTDLVGKPTSDRCGSSYIDLSFKRWLRKEIGEKNYNILDESSVDRRINVSSAEGGPLRMIMAAFEAHKKLFTRDTQASFKIDLPPALQNLTVGTYVQDGELTITSDVMRDFFDPCVRKIIGLLKGQLGQIDRRGYRLSTIFLVGGFGESMYLRQMLDHSFGGHFRKDVGVQVKVPDTSWTAVVRGAVLHGVIGQQEGNNIAIRQCSAHYGVLFYEPFDPNRRQNSSSYSSTASDARRPQGQHKWIISLGDIIPTERNQPQPLVKEIEHSISCLEGSSKKRFIPIYTYTGDDKPPDRAIREGEEELRELGQLDFDLSTVPIEYFDVYRNNNGQRPYYVARLSYSMSLIGRNLTVAVNFDGKCLASKTFEDVEP